MLDITLDPTTKGILYGVGLMCGLLIVGALGYREYDRTFDRIIIFNRRTRQPEPYRTRMGSGTFKLRRKDGEHLRIVMPEDAHDWKKPGAGSIVAMTETGHILGISPIDMRRELPTVTEEIDGETYIVATNSIDNPKLRPYDASLYAKMFKTTLAKRALSAFDEGGKSALNGKVLLIGFLVLLAVGLGGYFLYQQYGGA